MTDLAFHAIADIFPLMDGQPLADLTDDIKTHGLREPIWLYEGQILDGRNRYRACQAAGVEPVFVDYQEDDPVGFVVSLNLHRRHLNKGQKAISAGKAADAKKEDNLKRGSEGQICPSGKTTISEAAKQFDVGSTTVKSAKQVLKTGTKGLTQKVVENKVSVSTAADIATLPPNEQDIIVGLGEKAILMAAKEIRAKKKKARREELSQQKQNYLEAARKAQKKSFSDRCRLIHQDFRTAKIADSSLDRIITDPPYGHDYIPVYRDLAQFAVRTLKPDGVMLVMCGQMWFPEFLNQLTQSELHYQWLMAYLTPGGQSPGLFQRKVNTFWKPVLVFSKGESVPDWFGDVVTSSTNDNDKRFHEWGQSESGFCQLVNRFTRPGQTVCDPLMGAGTTLLAALQCGCQVIGIECDEWVFYQASERIQETINRV
ncbi:DNA modification methylase [Endozoicomonas sp. SESOKO1]|uniref:ParB/RepB/Spo0J family partition protein n=1 Tax=Endozoicomonas sp. SESOKO1 TaxID=2828742 RepID=UPI0021472435|nr:DNA modification methylase [Endozoicomonas sp. SESOKO1]